MALQALITLSVEPGDDLKIEENTLCFLHIELISMDLSILYFNIFCIFVIFLSLKIVFHLGLHCLPKYLFTGILNENVSFTHKENNFILMS